MNTSTTPASGDEPALSDERIIELKKAARCSDPAKQWGDSLAFARAIEAEVRSLAARQPPAAPAGDQGELPILPQSLIDQIGRYGLARTDGLSEIERIHLWTELIAGIKSYTARCIADPICNADLRAALARVPLLQAVPAGWVLAPATATNDMLLAMCEVKNSTLSGSRWVARDADLRAMWLSALAAAPDAARDASTLEGQKT